MAQKTFLVTGATGDTGGYTVEQLVERGHAVRALAHREDDRSKRLGKMGAEVVIGDFLKFNDVRAAMRGVRGAYFCYPIRPGILQATAYFAQAAKEAGLECVVNMSQKSAREDALSHAAQDHRPFGSSWVMGSFKRSARYHRRSRIRFRGSRRRGWRRGMRPAPQPLRAGRAGRSECLPASPSGVAGRFPGRFPRFLPDER